MGNIIALLKEIVELLKNKNDTLTLNIESAAKISGIGIHKINEMINSSNTDFPFFKVGAKTRINKKKLENWLDRVAEEHRVI